MVKYIFKKTGSGKTYSTFGNLADTQFNPFSQEGLVPLSIRHLFDTIKEQQQGAKFRIKVSFMQLYQNKITDLIPEINSTGKLVSQKTTMTELKLKEDVETGLFVKGLKQIVIH